jgi:hypothetical protein
MIPLYLRHTASFESSESEGLPLQQPNETSQWTRLDSTRLMWPQTQCFKHWSRHPTYSSLHRVTTPSTFQNFKITYAYSTDLCIHPGQLFSPADFSLPQRWFSLLSATQICVFIIPYPLYKKYRFEIISTLILFSCPAD